MVYDDRYGILEFNVPLDTVYMTTGVFNSRQQVIVSCLSVCLLTGLLKNCSSILYSFVEWLGEGHLKSNWLTLGDRDSTVVQMSKYFFLPVQRIRKRGICYGNVAGWVSVTHPYCSKTAKAVLKLFGPSGCPSF